MNKTFFLRAMNIIEPKLNMNYHWMAPYMYVWFVFCVDLNITGQSFA